MICPYCGATLPDGSKTCRDCGKPLRPAGAAKTEIVAENLSDSEKTSVFPEKELGKTQVFSEGLEPVGAFLGWLVITEGPDQWKEFHIPAEIDQTLVGCGEASDIRLNDETLSRIHISIRKKGDDFYLTDLDTESGTKVNGTPVERVKLQDGDRIQIGKTTIAFKLL